MNAQTQISNGNQSVGLLNLEAFELSQRIAKMLSSSTLVPEQYRATVQKKAGKDEYGNQLWREEPNPNGLSNCVIALNMSNRMGADPLMVMQNLYLVNGRPSWSSQFIMAGINSSGRFSALRFEIQDLGEKEVECTETVWENRKPKKIIKAVKIHDFSCVAWAIERETGERLESSKITIEMAVKEGWYTKEGSKWQTMSEQMLRYRAASFFGRVYAPELLMGLRSAEEEQDRIIDVTPVAESKVINASDFKNIKNLILKAKTLVDLEELESSIYALSDESERNELIKLWKASADKHKIIDAEVSAKKPEPQHEEAPPVEEAKEVEQPKKARSRTAPKVVEEVAEQDPAQLSQTVKSEYMLALTGATQLDAITTLENEINKDRRLLDNQRSNLNTYIETRRRVINEASESVEKKTQIQQQPTAADPIKSNMAKEGLKNQIANAPSVEALKEIAETVRDYKLKLTNDDMGEVLADYSARKKLLEEQQDMFADVVDAELSYVESAILRIQNAKSQDDINDVYADPAFEELSGADQERIDKEAQLRESELQD